MPKDICFNGTICDGAACIWESMIAKSLLTRLALVVMTSSPATLICAPALAQDAFSLNLLKSRESKIKLPRKNEFRRELLYNLKFRI